jgi:hypothetical protein
MTEPNRYVVTVTRVNYGTYQGTFRYYLWAYTAADAKLQAETLGADRPVLGTKTYVENIEPYRKPGPFGDWEDNAVVER